MNTRLRKLITAVALTAVFLPVFLSALTTLELATTAKPPVIDGKLDPGEWDGAYAMSEFKDVSAGLRQGAQPEDRGVFPVRRRQPLLRLPVL